MDGLKTLFSRYVYLLLFIVYAVGIALSYVLRFPEGYPGFSFLILWLCFILLLFLPAVFPIGFEKMLGWLILVLVFLTALTHSQLRQTISKDEPLSLYEGRYVSAKGVVVSFPRYSESGISFFMQVHEITSEGVRMEHPKGVGKIYVFVRDAQGLALSYKYWVELSGTLTSLKGASNMGAFSMRDYLKPFGVGYQIFVPTPGGLRILKEASFIGRLFYRLKEGFVRRANSSFPSPYSELFLGLTIGDSAIYFPQEIKETFRTAGLTHLLVVSGTQVSLFFLIIGLILLRFESPFTVLGKLVRYLKYPLILFLVLGYSILTGFEPSIQRAFIVSTLLLIAHFLYYETDSLHVIGQAGLIILILRPAELLSVSFQLTFAATIGLVLMIRGVMPLLGNINYFVRASLTLVATTSGAQIMVLPALLYYFAQITPYGLISNLVAIPVSFLIILLALGYYLVGALPLIGTVIWWLTIVNLKFLYWWASFFSSLPGASVPYVPISSLTALLAFGILFSGFVEMGLGQKLNRFIIGFVCLLMSVGILLIPVYQFNKTLPVLRVFYFHSGNASLYINRNRTGILFVEYPNTAERQNVLHGQLTSLLSRSGIRRLSLVVVLGKHFPEEKTWRELRYFPKAVINGVTGEVKFSSLSEAWEVEGLDYFFGPNGQLATFILDLGGGADVVIPVRENLKEFLRLELPSKSTEGSSGLSGSRVLLIPNSAIKPYPPSLRTFITANEIDKVILEGSGNLPPLVQELAPRSKFFGQVEKKEICVRPRGVVTVFEG